LSNIELRGITSILPVHPHPSLPHHRGRVRERVTYRGRRREWGWKSVLLI